MNRDEIIAIAFSFVNSEKVMKERYNKYHNDCGKYITDDMFVFNKFDRITEIKEEPAGKLRKQFKGNCFNLAYCVCEYLKTNKYITGAMVMPIKRRHVNSVNDLLWKAYSDCGESKECYWHAVTVFRTRNERCYVLDITHCNKVYEFEKWLTLTAEFNNLNIKDFRYDKNMIVTGNVSLGIKSDDVHAILTLCDSLLGKPQCNILVNTDETTVEGDDLTVNCNVTGQEVMEITHLMDATSAIRIRALYNTKIEGQLRTSYYARHNMHPSDIHKFNNDELVMQDIEMYCSIDDFMYASLACCMMGML